MGGGGVKPPGRWLATAIISLRLGSNRYGPPPSVTCQQPFFTLCRRRRASVWGVLLGLCSAAHVHHSLLLA